MERNWVELGEEKEGRLLKGEERPLIPEIL